LGANLWLAFTPLAGAGPLLGNGTISVAKPLESLSINYKNNTLSSQLLATTIPMTERPERQSGRAHSPFTSSHGIFHS